MQQFKLIHCNFFNFNKRRQISFFIVYDISFFIAIVPNNIAFFGLKKCILDLKANLYLVYLKKMA